MRLSEEQSKIVEQAIEHSIRKVEWLNKRLGDRFPSAASKDLRYERIDNTCWTAGFITGLQHLCYGETQAPAFMDQINRHLESFHKRLVDGVELDTHDLGFLYEYSALAAYKRYGNGEAKKDALEAAEHLYGRYFENAGIIQAWGNLNDPAQRGRMIIDCNMNLPLLYWAGHETGDSKYYEAALNHVHKAMAHIIRDDRSTYHTYYFDTETGEALRGVTHQGYSDESCWARGQAWAIYGFAISYDYTKDSSLLSAAMDSADYFIEHLPKDKVPYWDLVFSDGDDQKRDSSSAAIAACGLMELSQLIARKYPEKACHYEETALTMVLSLIDKYSVIDESADGLILHSVYSMNENNGIDECTTWGDYYYLEALLRMVGRYERII